MSRSVLTVCLVIGCLTLISEGKNMKYLVNKTKKLFSGGIVDTPKEVCFKVIGCLNMTQPWSSATRPLPVPMAPEKQPVRLLFFSRPNIKEQYTIKTYPQVDLGDSPFNSKKRTVIIIHGFANNGSSEWMHRLKDVYLDNVDANVMLVDWGPGAQKFNYLLVASNTRVVAKLIVRVLNLLVDKHKLDLSEVHLMGHSLGAHIAAYIGKETPGIGRLTALDPAQPAFEGYDKQVRLNKLDARFIDVIHTDGKPFIPTLGLGMVNAVGDVDFFFNGGFEQPGCMLPKISTKITSLNDLKKITVEHLYNAQICNHGRAYEYLIEAFNSKNKCVFWGHKFKSKFFQTFTQTITQGYFANTTFFKERCTTDKCVPVGYNTEKYNLTGSFYVTTRKDPPFCIPEQEPENIL